jgi:hypothetical protein
MVRFINLHVLHKRMYCRYSREAGEMYCVLRKVPLDIELCWNKEALMKKCKRFKEIDKYGWIKIQNRSDEEFLREEGLL